MKISKKTKELIVSYFEIGATPGEISQLTDISPDDLIQLCETDKEIKKARALGPAGANYKVVEALLKSATGYEVEDTEVDKRFGRDLKTVVYKGTRTTKKTVLPNIQAIKFWLDNKDSSWKDSMSDAEKNLNIKISIDGKDIVVTKDE